MTDEQFRDHVAERLAALPGVLAVTLGGSRAQGTARPDSDWDFGIYYRGDFRPEHLRAIGWPGEVSELGAWGGGVFNGGAWLTVEGRHVDVHYRDLDVVERELGRARAALTLRYARGAYLPRAQVTEFAAALATAAMYTAHAILAERGEWVTNEKRLLARAGLRDIDAVVAELRPQPGVLGHALARAETLLGIGS
ncbi:nucleotidyltransferase domain-containing protein [Nocardia farcinica]